MEKHGLAAHIDESTNTIPFQYRILMDRWLFLLYQQSHK